MANERRRSPDEERLLWRLRLIASIVILSMVVLIVTVDLFGRLFIDPNFRASELFLGTMIGALMILLGLEVVTRPRKP